MPAQWVDYRTLTLQLSHTSHVLGHDIKDSYKRVTSTAHPHAGIVYTEETIHSWIHKNAVVHSCNCTPHHHYVSSLPRNNGD